MLCAVVLVTSLSQPSGAGGARDEAGVEPSRKSTEYLEHQGHEHRTSGMEEEPDEYDGYRIG